MKFFLRLHVLHFDLRLESLPLRYFKYHRLTYELFCADDPYAVADKWLLKENLPLTYRQQVVEFILQNSVQNNFVPDPSFRDPYTGGKRVRFYIFFGNHLKYYYIASFVLLTLDFINYVSGNAYVPGQPSSSNGMYSCTEYSICYNSLSSFFLA